MSVENITLFADDGSIQTNTGLEQPELAAVREVYRQILASEDFPYCCAEAGWRLLGQGFRSQAGWFCTDLPNDLPQIPTRNFRYHTWSLLGRKIIDLTAFQFNPYLKIPLPTGIIIVETRNPLCNRYIYPHNPIVDQLGLVR